MANAKKITRATARLKAAKKRESERPVSAAVPAGFGSPDRAEAKTDNFYVVGIGASAGGLEAFEGFFRNMLPDSGMAFVLVPHLAPTYKSIMGDLLKRHTRMEIFEVKDVTKIEPNRVYIIPPNRDMSLMNGILHLLEPAESGGIRHPIDFFFRSLAEDLRDKAVCVVLSGTGTEGAMGLKAIKGEGGLVIAQDPTTAKYDGMPSSAIATGLVDYVLPPEKMPEYLLRYVRRVPVRPIHPVKPEEKMIDPLQKIFFLIRARTGHDFSLYKHSAIMRRIEKRMYNHRIETLQNYVTFLRKTPQEIDSLFRDLLINVTNFFRDPEAFEAIKEKALPLVFKGKSHNTPVRIWIPGCSTGEEAYSLAMVVQEYIRKLKGNFKVQIFATDIDGKAVEAAREGKYPESIAVDVSADRLGRFFVRKDGFFKVKRELREMVVFAVQNVIKDPPFTRLDLISCRNLLIYLGPELHKKILPIFHYSLKPGGVLFLGSSETAGSSADMFSVLDRKWKLFTSKAGALQPALVESVPPLATARAKQEMPAMTIKKPGDLSIGQLTEKLLLDHYSPSSVVVNEKGDILYFHGRTGKYLEPASGKATLNIFEMAREGLRLELGMALGKAASKKTDVVIKGLHVKTNGAYQTINLEVTYIKRPEHLHGLMMVVFREAAAPVEEKKGKAKPRASAKVNKRIDELEFEMKSAKEHLQTTIEELYAANEELNSNNEELQSANEELQSTNEELETSREELQSLNEELMTVNAELQDKIGELADINNDMTNLMAATQIATIFLNTELRIKRFTPAMTGVINLIQSDVGRPLSDIASKIDYPELVRDAEEVLRSLASKEKTVKNQDSRWYLTRLLPYRTVDDVIDGVVVTFVDISEQKKAQESLEDTLAFSSGILETVREPLVILDAELHVMSANKSFYSTFGVSRKDTENRLIYDLGSRQWDIPELRGLLEKILPESAEFQGFEVEHEFPGIGKRKMLLNARRIYQTGKKTEMILLAIEEKAG